MALLASTAKSDSELKSGAPISICHISYKNLLFDRIVDEDHRLRIGFNAYFEEHLSFLCETTTVTTSLALSFVAAEEVPSEEEERAKTAKKVQNGKYMANTDEL